MQERVQYIDIAKGICILIVVMGHILQYNFDGSGVDNARCFIKSFQMPVFMLLSGYVAAFSSQKVVGAQVATFIRKKATSLLIPFFVWGLLVSPFIIRRLPASDFLPTAKALLLHPETGAWFLIVLFCIQMYFLVHCLAANVLKKIMSEKCGWLIDSVVFGIIFSVLLVIPPIVSKSLSPEMGGVVKFYISSRYVLFFFLGYFFCRYLKTLVFNPWSVAVLTLLFATNIWRYTDTENSPLTILLLGLLASVIVLNIACALEHSPKFLSSSMTSWLIRFGRCSLVIYVTHYALITVMPEDVRIQMGEAHAIPIFILVAFLAVITCYLCERWSTLISENRILDFLLYGRKKRAR